MYRIKNKTHNYKIYTSNMSYNFPSPTKSPRKSYRNIQYGKRQARLRKEAKRRAGFIVVENNPPKNNPKTPPKIFENPFPESIYLSAIQPIKQGFPSYCAKRNRKRQTGKMQAQARFSSKLREKIYDCRMES